MGSYIGSMASYIGSILYRLYEIQAQLAQAEKMSGLACSPNKKPRWNKFQSDPHLLQIF